TAVAGDAAGNSAPSTAVSVTVSNGSAGGSTGGSGSGSGSASSVTWTKAVNATASPGSLVKTSGCDGCQNAGAVSVKRLWSNGYMEFTASETTTLRYIGLAPINVGTAASQVRFGFALQPGGIAEVREAGVYKGETPFSPGDVLRVAGQSRVVKYYKNGTLIYTSKSLAPVPVLVDASLLSLGATVTNVVLSGGL